MQTNFRKYKQQGFTLLELGIVVTIALILVGVGVTKVPKIMADNRANSEISELPQIVTNTQKSVANQQSYTGMTLDTLIRHKLKVLGVANGQRVPEDWHRLPSTALVQRALKGAASGAWRMDNTDVNLIFAGAPLTDGMRAVH